MGCGVALFIVLFAFYGMLFTTEKVAKRKKEQLAMRRAQTATQSLQIIGITLSSYEAANEGKLPPMTTPDLFKGALIPNHLTDTSMLIGPRDNQPFVPNPVLSGKKRTEIKTPSDQTFVVAEATANPAGIRTVLFLSGAVRDVTEPEWAKLQKKP